MTGWFLPSAGIRQPRKRHLGLLALCWLGVLAGVGCEAPVGTGGGEGPGRRAQTLALSPRQELELGRQAYREMLSHPREFGRVVPSDYPECQRTRDAARRIIQ